MGQAINAAFQKNVAKYIKDEKSLFFRFIMMNSKCKLKL